MKLIRETFTFDDVLLVPRRSAVFSRKDVTVRAQFSRNITLTIPLVSANMDTVTEARMARFMAEAGGIGIIHRFLPIDQQAEEVRKVKRAENVVIEDPYVINPEQVIADAERIMRDRGVSGLPVVDEAKRVLGIVTRRDALFTQDKQTKIARAMTKRVITAPRRISQKAARDLLFAHRIEKLPLVDSKGRLCGLITLKDMLRQGASSTASKDRRGRFLVGAAVGVKAETKDRAKALVDAGADVLVVDIAHGHNTRAIETIKKLKRSFPGIEIVGGNVATPDGALDLINSGADSVKVGVGPGAACITRIVTGVGVPQLSALLDIFVVAQKHKIPVIADGGIRNSGDFAKALAAGGSTAMIGSLLAGTDEAPGEYILEDGAGYKLYRGMASRDAALSAAFIHAEREIYRAPEGKSGKVSYRGRAQLIVDDLLSGLRSSMSYLGAKNISEFQKNAEFVRISPAALRESHSHDMK
ncbi:IMP dehydrogenase [Candidatus Giovannonibacteria bacterium RIFCSPHIGHO2_02_FULL_46_20]|uniref:IMP dehydrogenase n=1 Tax=Candidatus Giovannonibacteria bacterium RIFCSPHIGHO2_02_FULL_46_20 TaxID=1798338 RepID=A0A1F5WG19_9BACT|nr:MAG: IMP dehydrogenase [Candidatus Giovannonibacteria bacterium RIFCSPHIGHO2_02_FULL_46_20]